MNEEKLITGATTRSLELDVAAPGCVPSRVALDPDHQVDAGLIGSLVNAASEYFLVIDADRRIFWANAAFHEAFPGSLEGRRFAELLVSSSADAFRESLDEGDLGELELHHPVSGGVRIVSYRFVDTGCGFLAAMGIDRSREMEIVTQMSVLVEELEKEIHERITLAQRLEELARTDGLTGLLNRRCFDRLLAQEWTRWQRYRSRFALLLLDIDRFKKINDTHGHMMGDEVLRRIGEVLNDVVRKEDFVARYGGEEFAVIAIGADSADARELARRLLTRVRSAPMPPPLGQITISVGMATPEDSQPTSVDHLIRLADSALYHAKESGRDLEILSGEDIPPE